MRAEALGWDVCRGDGDGLEEVGVGAVLAQELVLKVGACLEGGVLTSIRSSSA